MRATMMSVSFGKNGTQIPRLGFQDTRTPRLGQKDTQIPRPGQKGTQIPRLGLQDTRTHRGGLIVPEDASDTDFHIQYDTPSRPYVAIE